MLEGGLLNLVLWEMSQTAIKCVFLSGGDYFMSCGMKTLRGSCLLDPWLLALLGHASVSSTFLGRDRAALLLEQMTSVASSYLPRHLSPHPR